MYEFKVRLNKSNRDISGRQSESFSHPNDDNMSASFSYHPFILRLFCWLVVLLFPFTATVGANQSTPISTFNPVIGELQLGSMRRLVVQGEFVYTILNTSLVVILVNDPTNPIEVGRLDTGVFIYDIAVSGHYVYLATAIGVQIINVADPLNLQVAGQYIRDNVLMLELRDNYLYLLSQSQTGSSLFDGLDIVSIHQSPQLLLVGHYPIPNASHRDLDLVGDYAFVIEGFSGYPLYVINISNPSLPYLEKIADAVGNQVAINGNFSLGISYGCSSFCSSYFVVRKLNWLTWETEHISTSTYLFSAHSFAIEADAIYAYVGKDVGLVIFNYHQEPFGSSLPIIAYYDVGDVSDIALTEGYIFATTDRGFYIMPRPTIYKSYLPLIAHNDSSTNFFEP